MLQTLFQIARNTFRESIRQPIFLILLLCSLAIIGNYPAFVYFVFREEGKLVTDGSLATVLLFGWITAVLLASHAITREIETGTVLLILSKPVNRAAFLLAKTLGVLAALTLFVWIAGLGTLLSVRIAKDQFQFDVNLYSLFFGSIILSCLTAGIANYYRRHAYPAAAVTHLAGIFTLAALIGGILPQEDFGSWGPWFQGYDGNVARALLLILFAAWAMGTLATALSTRLNLVSNLTVCTVIFLLGLLSDFIHMGLTRLDMAGLERFLHSWPLLLAGLVALVWLLAAKQYNLRRDSRVPLWQVHAAGGTLTGLLLLHGIIGLATRSYLRALSPELEWLARGIFQVKGAVAAVCHALLPNWQLFWLADALAAKQTIPAAYLGLAAAYIVFFICAFMLLAQVLFTAREVGEQSQQ